MRFDELEREREFKFVESLRVIEYDEEEEIDEEEQIKVIAVQLFYSYHNDDMKKK